MEGVIDLQADYKRDFHHSYLILEDEAAPDSDSYAVRMLTRGIPGLLCCDIHKVDNRIRFCYEITSKQSLGVVFETGKFNRDQLAMLIGALVRTMEEMESYLLSPDWLLLNPVYIYVNMADREVAFCCWPGGPQEGSGFQDFAEYLLPKIDHADQDAVVIGYQLYRQALDGQIIPDEIRRELYRENAGAVVTDEPEEEESSEEEDSILLEEEHARRQEMMEHLLLEMPPEKESMLRSVKIAAGMAVGGFLAVLLFYVIRGGVITGPLLQAGLGGLILSSAVIIVYRRFRKNHAEELDSREKVKREKKPVSGEERGQREETVSETEEKQESVSSGGEERNRNAVRVTDWSLPGRSGTETFPDIMEDAKTCLLCEPAGMSRHVLYAVHPADLPDITLREGTTILGKLASTADVVLPSAAVSRIHAKIHLGETCIVYDLNSRNGTYINRTDPVGYEGRVLSDGDTVTFADLTYRYGLG